MKKISLLLFLIIFSIIGYSGTTLPFNVDTTTHKNIVIKKNLIFRDTSLRHSNSLLSIDSITGKLILINDNLNSSKFINGLTKINDSIYLGGNLLNKTEIFQDTFGLKFINKKDDRYYVINNKPGSICLETTIDTIEQLNGFGKSSFYLDSNSISLNVFDNDFFGYLGERGMVYNQSDTLISIYSMDFIDSHKEINIDRNNIVLSGGMSSGGVYQTVDDRRISFTHWHDNGLGGNDTSIYIFPDSIGLSGQVLTADGDKNLYWSNRDSIIINISNPSDGDTIDLFQNNYNGASNYENIINNVPNINNVYLKLPSSPKDKDIVCVKIIKPIVMNGIFISSDATISTPLTGQINFSIYIKMIFNSSDNTWY